MKPFESFLTKDMEAFIAYRISLGYSQTHMRTYLRHLDRYALKHHSAWDDLNPAYILKFKASLQYAPKTVNGIMSVLRTFLGYLQRVERIQENPAKDVPDSPKTSFIPYIFSENDTERLLTSANRSIRKNERHFFGDYKRCIALMLLAHCGLRISEPLRLKSDDFCREDGTIHIRKTKFKKNRRIPMPKPLVGHMENYLSVRNALNVRSPFLFPGHRAEKMTVQSVREFFNQAVVDIGCNQPDKKFHSIRFGKPTPHCLRHSFAINTLKRIRERGASPQHALPILAAYMGHAHYTYTAVYLKALDAEDRNMLFDIAQAHWESR
jgi:integrase/recombinase XerD